MDVSEIPAGQAVPNPAPSSGRAELDCAALRYRDGSGAEQRVVLAETRPRLLIGRGECCNVVIDDLMVSGEHAVLELMGTHWYISDEGMSRNGTYVNRERVTGRRRLQAGDRLLVGRTLLTFRAPTPTAADRARLPTQTERKPLVVLTAAQERVLRALCAPLIGDPRAVPPSNGEIAAELCVREDTVKDHMQELFRKFGVQPLRPLEKRITLARRALDRGQV